MVKRINKNIYRGILILSFVVVNGLILVGISSVLSYLNTGADRTSMLHLEVKREEVYQPSVVWQNIDNPGRLLEKQTQSEIERDYLSAWYVRNIAYKNNDYYGIKDYYTDSAKVKLYKTIDFNLAHNTKLTTTTLNHNLSLKFYSEDGTLAVIEDNNVAAFHQVFKNDNLMIQERDTSSYKIMLLLEDGFWRIRHMVKFDNDNIMQKPKINLDLTPIKKAKGLNYYPKDSPWDTFGKKFNEDVIDKDFKLIDEMGINTIRIFVPFEDFGKSQLDYEKVNRLRRTLELAEKNHLKVIITLFDFYGNYEVTDWTITAKHATLIVEACKDAKALLAWDVKNEPDLDFESRGKLRVLNWLEQMVVTIRNNDPNHAITVGWSSPEAGSELVDMLDFISFHYYRDIASFEDDYTLLKSKAKSKPIMLQEYGLSSYRGLWNFYLGSDEKQASYYAKFQPLLATNDIPFLAWTLYDFTEVPTSVVGRLPWRKSKQYYFGFLDSEGKKKAAYTDFVVKNKAD